MNHPTIKLAGGHLNEPPSYAIPFFTAIGLVVAHWGRLEQQIDVLLISINKEQHSSEKYRPTPSTSFRMKCDLFKRWFVDDPRFGEHHEKAKRLHKSFLAASDDRNLLVHSNLQEFIEGPPPKMIARNIKIEGKGQNVRISRGEWTEDQIINAGKQISGINLALYEITHKVLKPQFLDTLQTS